MAKIKSNPYVYPYTPFADLSNRKILDNFSGKELISWKVLKERVAQIANPEPRIAGKTRTEKVLSVFLDDNYRFGPREFIEKNKGNWLEKINHFIEANKPLSFTILGFPFKIPNPLKTNRKYPDMGEVLLLLRLHTINQYIEKLYSPGALTTIFTEGALGPAVGVSLNTAEQYAAFLSEINNNIGFSSNLTITALSEMESMTDNFNNLYQAKIDYLKKLYKDKEFLEKYEGAKNSILRIVNTQMYPINELFEVYDDKLNDNQVTSRSKQIREDIHQRTHEALFKYFAYLMVRDDLNFIQRKVPGALTLSVSPKPNRLGIIPVNSNCIRLPYHGVTVYRPEQNQYSIEYLIDLRRQNKPFTPVHLEDDPDSEPFYYITNS